MSPARDADRFRVAVLSVVKHDYLPRGVASHPRFELAVVAESARWGDIRAKKRTEAPPLTRDEHWRPAVDLIVERYFPQRVPIVIEQLRAVGLY